MGDEEVGEYVPDDTDEEMISPRRGDMGQRTGQIEEEMAGKRGEGEEREGLEESAKRFRAQSYEAAEERRPLTGADDISEIDATDEEHFESPRTWEAGHNYQLTPCSDVYDRDWSDDMSASSVTLTKRVYRTGHS